MAIVAAWPAEIPLELAWSKFCAGDEHLVATDFMPTVAVVDGASLTKNLTTWFLNLHKASKSMDSFWFPNNVETPLKNEVFGGSGMSHGTNNSPEHSATWEDSSEQIVNFCI